MVGREGFGMDWLDEAGEHHEEVAKEGGRRVANGGQDEEWRRNGNEDDDENKRKRRRAVEAEDENDEMLELRLSLAVAISVPSPHQQSGGAGSFLVRHQQQNNHLPQPQQHSLAVGRNQSPVKHLLQQRDSSPLLDNHRASSRASLTASLKHLASQQPQQALKVKSVQRIPPGSPPAATRPPLQYGTPQLPRPQTALARASHISLDGQVGGGFFQSVSRTPPTSQVVLDGHHRPHANQPMLPKGLPQQIQPRPSAHRASPRSASSLALLHQACQEPTKQGQSVLVGDAIGPFSAHPRIVTTIPYPSYLTGQAPSATGAQVQAFLQHQASTAVSVASHRQTQPSSHSGVTSLGKNPSAFSVVRPSVSGAIPSNVGDISSRDRGGDGRVVVNICDRKVRLSSEQETTSLYALCRRWVRNDLPRRDQSMLWDSEALPRPLTAEEAEKTRAELLGGTRKDEPGTASEMEWNGSVDSLSEAELLQQHVEHFKKIRKRFKEDRINRIARFMPRLALLLPAATENNRRDALLDLPHL